MRLRGGFELWGFPGSGKSTQAHLLRGRSDVNLVELGSLTKSAATRPQIAFATIRQGPMLFGLSNSLLGGRHPDGAIARVAIRQKVALARRADSLIEEGVLHEIWRALFNSPDYLRSGTWQGFVKHGGPNVIVLNVSRDEALRRIRTKVAPGPINRELATAAPDSQTWERAVAAYAEVLQAVRGVAGLSVSQIDVEKLAPEAVSERIVQIVQASLGGQAAHAR